MNEINKLIDLSVWTGSWPFTYFKYGNMEALKERLEALGVKKAYIAPIEGILEQDPMRSNLKLLSEIRDDFFSPVVILDLSYENWTECLQAAINDGRVRMVKIIPNYHVYQLNSEKLKKLVEITSKSNIIISVQMRVEDKRGQYPLMKVADIQAHEVVGALSGFPGQTFIINNAVLSDLQIILNSLDNVYIDISSIEQQDILEKLNNEYSLDKFVFSSHSPFFYPEGNINKLKFSRLNIDEINKVAYKNAEKIFG